MSGPSVRAEIVRELGSRGYALTESEHEIDLIGAGVNSVTLIRLISALEDAFDVELDAEILFSGPVTIARLEAEIARIAALAPP